MGNPETETMITINQADRDEGFFRVGTSYRPHYEKILKRIGGADHLVEIKTSSTKERDTWWELKIPIKYLSLSNFGIRVHSDKKRQIDPNRFKKKTIE